MARGSQVINGTEYVYEYDSVWNTKKRYGTHRRTYIGKIVNGKFLSNKKYQLQIELQNALNKELKSASTKVSSRRFYGATYLFDSIGEKIGINSDLKECFPENWRQILSIAYYLILEDHNPLCRFPKWASSHVHPYGNDIPSQRSSELFANIDENAKQMFFKLQSKRKLEKEFLAYDITSISSYSKTLKQVKYGKNKEHEPLPQINLALLFGEKSRLPVYYRKLAGNITDVKTMSNLLADIEFIKGEKISLVMDRGFYSEENINSLYRKHCNFLIAAKLSVKFFRDKLDSVRKVLVTRQHYSSKYKIYFTTVLVKWPYRTKTKNGNLTESNSKVMYLHIYYNNQRAVDDKNDFNNMLDMLEDEILTDNKKPEHEKLYNKYYEINKNGINFIPKQEAIETIEKNYGYFALISNSVEDPLDALGIYRSKDVIEKAFGNLKERLNMRRTSVSSTDNLEGKLFVQFVALIYLSYIDQTMNDHSLYKKYTMHELLDELDIIELYERPEKDSFIGEMTKKQLELYKCFGVDAPV